MKIFLLAGFASSIVGFYFYNFNDYLTHDQSIWGAFGDYIGGILNPVIAFFVFYYVVKNYESQKKYFKKQEFENHFFKLYDEFKLEQENIHQIKIFEQYNKQISEDNITEVEEYIEWIYSRSDYPKAYFNLLEFLLTYIYENKQIEQYIFFIKNKFSNLDLAYIALHDISTNHEILSKILKKSNIYEHFDVDDDDVVWSILIFKDYSLLSDKLHEIASTEKKD